MLSACSSIENTAVVAMMLHRNLNHESIAEVVAKYSPVSIYLILIILKRFIIYPRSMFAQFASQDTR